MNPSHPVTIFEPLIENGQEKAPVPLDNITGNTIKKLKKLCCEPFFIKYGVIIMAILLSTVLVTVLLINNPIAHYLSRDSHQASKQRSLPAVAAGRPMTSFYMANQTHNDLSTPRENDTLLASAHDLFVRLLAFWSYRFYKVSAAIGHVIPAFFSHCRMIVLEKTG